MNCMLYRLLLVSSLLCFSLWIPATWAMTDLDSKLADVKANLNRQTAEHYILEMEEWLSTSNTYEKRLYLPTLAKAYYLNNQPAMGYATLVNIADLVDDFEKRRLAREAAIKVDIRLQAKYCKPESADDDHPFDELK